MDSALPGPDFDRSRSVRTPGRSTWVWLVMAVVVTAALAFALVGLAWRGRVPLSSEPLDPQILTSVALVAIALIGVLSIAVLLLSAKSSQTRPGRPISWRQVLGRLLLLALLVLLARSLDLDRLRPPSSGASDESGGGRPAPATDEVADPASVQPLSMLLVALLLLGVIAILVALSHRAARADFHPEAADPTASRLGRAAFAGREALELGTDERSAVIACYEAMQVSLEGQGLEVSGSDTASDLLERAVALRIVCGSAPARLIELFGIARFSAAPLPPDAVQQARTALRTIEAQLTSGVRG